ncbi:MAG: arsenic resistance N-acetyltransferase ArsN2 [Desulfobacterales bacterium]|nr:arsenic resistance N-acetyltransferase ArsN2 [Desulfobacterales bacterium]
MNLADILVVTVSGVRTGEEDAVRALIGGCGLSVEDITGEGLRDFLAARKESEVIGVVGLEFCGPDALLRSLAVAETHRGQGVAKLLAASAEKYARSRKAATLYLLTETADGFFAGRGYERIDRGQAPEKICATAEFSRICPDSAVCMLKPIVG